MVDVLGKLTAVANNPKQAVRQWKEAHGKKVIACAPMQFPEELVHAAGLLPIVLQEGDEAVTVGYSHMHSFFCSFACSSVDMSLKGKLDFLDGVMFPETCLPIRSTCDILRRHQTFPYIEDIQLPRDLRSRYALSDAMEELQRVKSSVEQFAGRKVSEDDLRQSIAVYNRNRSLLGNLYQLRRQRPGILAAKEMQAIIQASMLMSKEEHSALLEQLLSQLEPRKPAADGKCMLFLSAHLCEAVKEDILDAIERVAAVVVDDDLYYGYRYFGIIADEKCNPIEALAKRYLGQVPCPTRLDLQTNWGEYLVSAAKASAAEGILVLVVKFCEPHLIYYPQLRASFQEAGIEHLLLETEHDVSSLGPIETRLQAFIEMIRTSR